MPQMFKTSKPEPMLPYMERAAAKVSREQPAAQTLPGSSPSFFDTIRPEKAASSGNSIRKATKSGNVIHLLNPLR